MADIQPPPTYTDPVRVDELGKARFSEIWLNWFLQLAEIINGGGGTVLQHNSLSGLQGGTTAEYYHLTAAQRAAAFGTKNANTVYAGPTTGAAADPTFRALVAADIPASVQSNLYAAVHG